ncbi:periphilin-1 isoform X2 [Narcine bancroftii]
MWSESRSQCGERNQPSHFHSGSPHNAEFQRTVQITQRRQDYNCGAGGGRGTTSHNYTHLEDYRGYSADNRDSGHDRRFGPSLKTGSWDDENSRWPRDEHAASRQANRNNLRKNFYCSPHARERSPQRREASYYRRESPRSHSGSSISSRGYSPEQNKQPPSYQSQFNKTKDHIEEEMWSESRSQCGERNQPGHFHSGRPHNAEFQRTVKIMQRRQDYDCGAGGGGGGGGRGRGTASHDYNYYTHLEDYRGYSADNRDFGHGRRFGPSLKTSSWDDENSRWPRDEHAASRQANRNNLRKNFYCSPHARERSPQRREASYYRRESPQSHSGSSISSRGYSPEQNKQPPSYQSQFNKNKERSVCPLMPPRDASPSISIPPLSSKSANFDKGSKTSDNLDKEIINDMCPEQQQIPELEITERDTGDAIQMLLPDKLDKLEMNALGPLDIIELSQTDHRTRKIAEKTKEIEEVYRQDCETFGMVVQMLIEKDPSLENSIQFALRENLREIGERCIEELRKFIIQYDSVPGEHGASL